MTRYLIPFALGVVLSLGSAACGSKKADPAKGGATPATVEAGTPAAKVDGKKTVEPPTAVTKTSGKTPADTTKRITGPVAKVNGVAIDSKEFYDERDKITARGAKIPADRLARIEQNILKRLIEKQLIDQAVKKQSVEVPAADIEAGFAEYKKRFQNEEQFQNYLKHGRVTKGSIEARIKDRRALELLLEKRGDMKVTDAEAQEFYKKNERFYTDKAGIRASHILIKVPQKAAKEEEDKAMEKIKAAQAEIAKGTDFGEIAKKMSEGPSAPKGGDLGFFGAGRMVKPFEEVAFKMEKDAVSDPVRTRFGFHIIKVTDKREDRKKPFEEVKEQIVKSLKNKKFFTERRKLLAELEKAAKVEKFIAEPPPAPKRKPGAHGKAGHGHGPGSKAGHGHPAGRAAKHPMPHDAPKVKIKPPVPAPK